MAFCSLRSGPASLSFFNVLVGAPWLKYHPGKLFRNWTIDPKLRIVRQHIISFCAHFLHGLLCAQSDVHTANCRSAITSAAGSGWALSLLPLSTAAACGSRQKPELCL